MIKNRTILDYKKVSAFKSKMVLKNQIFMTFLSVFVAVMGIVEITFGDIWFGVLCIVAGVAFCVFIWTIQLIFTKKALRTVSMGKVVSNVYTFDDNGCTIESFRENEPIGLSKLSFEQIKSVKEYDQFIYIYVSDMQAYILDKQNFEEGSSAELSVLLATKLGDRYIVKLSSKKMAENKEK